MQCNIERKEVLNGFIALVNDENRTPLFTTSIHELGEDAEKEAQAWLDWWSGMDTGNADSIYYIMALPEDWSGSSIIDAHPYTGLRVKIGYSKNPQKRVKQLQTGTSDRLILHALEPGNMALEKRRHEQFASHRRAGEWFICSKALADHILDTWMRYRILPPEHQQLVIMLMERVQQMKALREMWPEGPDLINPPLDVSWKGKRVFLNLTGF